MELNIRPMRPEDADFILKCNENTGPDFLVQWSGPTCYQYPLTRGQILSHTANTESALFFTAIGDGTVIGTCELANIDSESHSCTFCRFLLAENSRGKGFGTEILREITRYAFEELDMHTVKLAVFAYNKGAIRCYEKVGYSIVDERADPDGNLAYRMAISRT